MAEKEKFWCTRYSLTDGVIDHLELEPSDGGEYFYDRRPGHWVQYRLDRDCFRDKARAIDNLNKRKACKIASLKKQIAKIEAMTAI